MDINIKINNKVKGFTAPFIPARMLKRTIVIGTSIAKDSNSEESFDVMAQYIADIYGKQFTLDDVLDGLSSVDLITEFTNCITEVTGGLNSKVNELDKSSPNVRGAKAKK